MKSKKLPLYRGVLLSTILLVLSVQLTSTPAQEYEHVAAGASIQKRIAAGEVHRYQLGLGAGQFLQIAVDERSIDVRMVLSGPDGGVIVEADTPNNSLDPERVLLVASAPGQYRLEIQSSPSGTASGSYSLQVEELRAATEADSQRLTAAGSLREADLLRGEGSAQSLRSSLAKYEKALAVCRSLGDRRREASSLFGVGKCRVSLGENQPALDAFNQALRILRDENDGRGQGVILNEIGPIHLSRGERQKALELYGQALQLHRAAENTRGEAFALNNIGFAHFSSGEHEKALEFYLQALSRNRESNFRRGEVTNLINLGSV